MKTIKLRKARCCGNCRYIDYYEYTSGMDYGPSETNSGFFCAKNLKLKLPTRDLSELSDEIRRFIATHEVEEILVCDKQYKNKSIKRKKTS